ncbi:hypothetical protein DL95DRAFT_428616 [Leptodontidium sp. 2 PMI_412]|nr:hypothetical protein DL95DRAFT_428616 [Leptodontidium sp. 2 PMI_412]
MSTPSSPPSPSLAKRLSQTQQKVLTTISKISQSNNNFLLSEVFYVTGKIALITGRGSGIRLIATQALAINRAKVYIVKRTKKKLKNVVKSHRQNIAREIIPIIADITSKSEIAKLVKEFVSQEKAEANAVEEMKKNLFDAEGSTFDDWLFFMTVTFLPLQHCHQHLLHLRKAAAIHLTKFLALEIASNGLKIRVNSIAPGVFPSEMTAGESGADQKSHIEKEKCEKVLAHRLVAVDGGYILHVGA